MTLKYNIAENTEDSFGLFSLFWRSHNGEYEKYSFPWYYTV
jgi:hypothetical protein